MADFIWCPAPNVGYRRVPRVTSIVYGDGYTHRVTIGINIWQDIISASFNGGQEYIAAIDTFLQANFLRGFTWSVWTEAGTLWVCDEWQLTWQDKNSSGLIGSIQAEFKRANNPIQGV